MDPNKIELSNLEKSFAYTQIAANIDSCSDLESLKNIAKSFAKLSKKTFPDYQILESVYQ